jgi:hypothetical protein
MHDELMQLWRQGTSNDPDPDAVARLAARATMWRFDRVIFWRNAREYAAGLLLMGVFGWQFIVGTGRVRNGIAFACVAFVMGYLWWRHRDLPRPDPAADARAYQAVMLERVDRQLQLLRTVRYWYLLPLYVPPLMLSWDTWQRGRRVPAVVALILVTVVYWLIARLNERFVVAMLLKERARIESLYQE